eukprot:7499800-Alexandrium_andersonii.AAC.1
MAMDHPLTARCVMTAYVYTTCMRHHWGWKVRALRDTGAMPYPRTLGTGAAGRGSPGGPSNR